jgi:hypothetical protein
MSFLNRSGKLAFALSIAVTMSLSACAPENGFRALGEETSHEGDDPSPPVLTAQEQSKLAKFNEPVQVDQAHVEQILSKYAHLDPNGEVPTTLLQKAVLYFDANQAHTPNKKYLSIVDFSQRSSEARLFIVALSTGAVWKLHVAHGKNSDKNDDGIAEAFSNINGSEMSSLGVYLTAETYSGKHGLSLRLDGLSSTNSNVRMREIVMHAATYVYDTNKKAGRSWGCLALPPADRDRAVSLLKGGSLIYVGLSQ